MYRLFLFFSKNFNIGFILLFFGTFLGRSLGYIRELIIAYLFGVSERSDEVLLLLTIPDIVNNIVSNTAIGTVIIPFLFRTNGSNKIFNKIKKYLIEIGLGITLVIALFIFIFFNSSIWIPSLIALVSVYANWHFALSISIAQYFQNFFFSSISNIVYNIGVIIAVITSLFGNFYLGICLFFTTLFRTYFSNIYNRKKGFKLNDNFGNSETSISRTEIFIGLFSSGLFYVIPSLDRILASKLSLGALSHFNYAEKIYYLPLSLLIAPLLQSVYPKLSKLIADKDILSFKSFFSSIALKIFLASIITTLLFIYFSDSIVRIFYSISSINSEDSLIISKSLRLFSITLFPSAMLLLFMNLYFTLVEFKRMFIYSFIFLILKILILLVVSQYPSLNNLLYGMIVWVVLFSITLFIDMQVLLKKL